jgi:hypothetical protein
MVKHARGRTRKELEPTGIEAIDKLADLSDCSLDDYIRAVSSYVASNQPSRLGGKKPRRSGSPMHLDEHL